MVFAHYNGFMTNHNVWISKWRYLTQYSAFCVIIIDIWRYLKKLTIASLCLQSAQHKNCVTCLRVNNFSFYYTHSFFRNWFSLFLVWQGSENFKYFKTNSRLVTSCAKSLVLLQMKRRCHAVSNEQLFVTIFPLFMELDNNNNYYKKWRKN